MKGKGCESQSPYSSSTHHHFPHVNPVSFKNSKSKSIPKSIPPNPNPNHANLQQLPDFTNCRKWNIRTTNICFLSTATGPPYIFSDIDVDGKVQLLHPLTLKPHSSNHRPIDGNLLYCQSTPLTSFCHTTVFPFEKLVIPMPRAATVKDDAMVVLYGGGKLLGRLPLVAGKKWVALSEDKFDDILATVYCTHVVDRLGRLYVINNITNSRDLKLGKAVITQPIPRGSVLCGWRKRIFVYGGEIYLVVREEEKMFRVYTLTRDTQYWWDDVVDFRRTVLFVSKGCCFFIDCFGVKEYENCIVFSESGFPKYGDDCWECNDEDQIGVFRITDKRFGRVGDSVDFPDINWSPPSWIFDVRGPDNDGRGVQSNANVEEDTSPQEDVPASLFASVSAVEEDVTRTLLRTNVEKEATEKESSRKATTASAPRACTSSSTAKGINSDSAATAKFEGFDVRSDLVPTLQKIWRNHGNIIENSTMCNSDIIARALESLATMVDILENNPIQSLSDFQAGYLSSALSDLKDMGFKMHWLVLFVEKAVKLHKSKAFVDSLNKLEELSSQVKERRDILVNEVAKLNEEENKLKNEMAKVSKLIPFSGQVKFDEPLGSGLT